jgi:hypothetical protein
MFEAGRQPNQPSRKPQSATMCNHLHVVLVRFIDYFQMGDWIKSGNQLSVDCSVDGRLVLLRLCGGREVDTGGMRRHARCMYRRVVPLAIMSDCTKRSSDIVTSTTLCPRCQDKTFHFAPTVCCCARVV